MDCGNIALFFVLKSLVYNPVVRPEELKNLDRFVDDISGQGMWRGSMIDFEEWVGSLRSKMVDNYGLDITYEVKPITEFTQFVDIQYKFVGGRLTTDLFRKPTDANTQQVSRILKFPSTTYLPEYSLLTGTSIQKDNQ